ncbi:NUDIX domain-containing protein [Acholeplasma sp. OttesenSCG-928-E16]|nr:NUDIX domain-containing protein [Acholeplasma sp. OttesenSCG-928-E16]
MKKISKVIAEQNIKKGKWNKRKTVRGIIIKDDSCLLVYSKMFDDYMFPGGGIKKKESKKNALARELKEELGALKIKIKKPFGYIKEKRYSSKSDHLKIIQTSYYYICDILEFGNQNLEYVETIYGVKPIWIKIEEAIKHLEKIKDNQIHSKKGIRTVMIRELIVLNKLLKRGKNESI